MTFFAELRSCALGLVLFAVGAGAAVQVLTPSASVPGRAPEAISDLASLRIQPAAAAGGGYDRDAFGQRWSDDVAVPGGHNGCDTRNDMLRRDLDAVVLKQGTRGCVVLSGTMLDPYTGSHITFTRGASAGVDVDHVVSLGDAWVTGAQGWSQQKRTDFANDPANLLVVSASANRAKGDRDAAEWLPPARSAHCDYVSRQVRVKATYGLWVTPAEHAAMTRALSTCPAPPPSANIRAD